MDEIMDARIGVITPDDGINDDELWAYLPERVNLLVTRYHTPERFEPISSDMVDTYADGDLLRNAAEDLRITRPSAVLFSCNSCSFVRGPGGDREIIGYIEDGCGAPATTITTAQIEALKLLGAKKVAVGAPYPQELADRLGQFLTASGYTVTSVVGLGMQSEWEIGNSLPKVWADLARRVNRPEADCVILACSGIRTSSILTSLEDELGKPVISAPAVGIWYALRLAGLKTQIQGRGFLLEHH